MMKARFQNANRMLRNAFTALLRRLFRRQQQGRKQAERAVLLYVSSS